MSKSKSSKPPAKSSEPPPKSSPPKAKDSEPPEEEEPEEILEPEEDDNGGDLAPPPIPEMRPPRMSEPEIEVTEMEAAGVPPGPPPKVVRGQHTETSLRLPEPAWKSVGHHTQRPPPATGKPVRKFPPETVGDIMTRKLIAMGENSPLANIEEGMQHYGFRHLPVVDENNKLLGLLTHRDVLRASSSTLSADAHRRNIFIHGSVTVGMLMRRNIFTARPYEPLSSAARTMLDRRIGCLPVVDENFALVGIVTHTDFVRLAKDLLEKSPNPQSSS